MRRRRALPSPTLPKGAALGRRELRTVGSLPDRQRISWSPLPVLIAESTGASGFVDLPAVPLISAINCA
jgi:hypothetical protein